MTARQVDLGNMVGIVVYRYGPRPKNNLWLHKWNKKNTSGILNEMHPQPTLAFVR